MLEEFATNVAREFGQDEAAKTAALSTLQVILEDAELEADVSANSGLDALSMRVVLVSYARLDEDEDPMHARIARLLPEGIRGRCHYCGLLRLVYFFARPSRK